MGLAELKVYRSAETHNLFNEPIEGSEIMDKEIGVSKLDITQNETERLGIGKIIAEGENLEIHSTEPPIITVHSKNRLRL